MFKLFDGLKFILMAATILFVSIIPGRAVADEALENSLSPSLIIAGGGLKSETESVWQAFIDKARNGEIIIIPSASGSPVDSADFVRETLGRYGVSPDRIKTAKLAIKDDPSTPDINEAVWAQNANDSETINLIKSAGAIWFTGGDQARTTAILLNNGRDTAAMTALRALAQKGVPIGGTSAGAAIMSDPMILGGDSLSSLISSEGGEPLSLGKGLGFFDFGLVDQHFGERARLGRLAKAISLQNEKRIGFGIDENTALIVNSAGTASVQGTGYVTIMDGRKMTQLGSKDPHKKDLSAMMGLQLHMMSAGDTIDLNTLHITPAPWKDKTVGNEYRQNAMPDGSGMAIPGQNLQTVIGDGLIDNAESRTVSRISFNGDGKGVKYVFSQTDESQGYWGRGPEGEGRYTISNVTFDIVPVTITITP